VAERAHAVPRLEALADRRGHVRLGRADRVAERQAPREPGFDITAVAETNASLMAKLGYTRYGAQGGDWGAIATAWLGRVDPNGEDAGPARLAHRTDLGD